MVNLNPHLLLLGVSSLFILVFGGLSFLRREGLSAQFAPEALGLTVKADVWLEVESDLILEVAKKLAAFENVTYVACGIGQNDISIQLVAKDTAEIYYFVTEVVRKVTGVRKTTTSIVPIIIKDVYQWRIPEKFSDEISNGRN